MYVGILTAPFNGEPLDNAIAFATEAGITGMEITAGPGAHIDTTVFTQDAAKKLREQTDASGIVISGLAYYTNICDGKPETAETFRKVMQAASWLGVDVVCAMAGMPVPGKSKHETIRDDVPKFYTPILSEAADLGLKIALENWTATNIQDFSHWDLLFDVLPQENFGLNYDPSHLIWQGIDYLAGVDRYKDRIFHTHAKDTDMKDHVRRHVGYLGAGWWRYVIPGFGQIDWGTYVERLNGIGYTGTLSIEHEDGSQGREEGFIRGARYLSRYVD